MQTKRINLYAAEFVVIAIIVLLGFSPALSADNACEGSGDYSYVCGLASAEDLVLIPGSRWIIASGFGGKASLYLVDTEQKTWRNFYPADEPLARQDMATYGACPGSPDPGNFVAHGLHIRATTDGLSTLYVVGHGEREAIEIFAVDASTDVPVLTWRGCVLTPDGMQANSVAALADGSLVATIPLHTGMSLSDAHAGKSTGAVYKWERGDATFTKIQGTELPYANGIEVSVDGEEFYVASSGLRKVLAFANSNPTQMLRSSATFSIIPDNLHRASDGVLLTAGLAVDDPVCGNLSTSLELDLEKYASCPRPFAVLAIDPQSLQDSVFASSPAQQNFSNITMALQVGAELWIGTFAGDRIAYRALE